MAYIIVKDIEADESEVFFYRTWFMASLHTLFMGGEKFKITIEEEK